MAVVLPFLAFVFAVATDFCRAYYAAQTVQNCAWAAALYASGTARSAPTTSAAQAARDAAVAEGTTLSPPLQSTDVAVDIDPDSASVTVSYNFSLITGFPGMSRTLPLVRTVRMPVPPKVGE